MYVIRTFYTTHGKSISESVSSIPLQKYLSNIYQTKGFLCPSCYYFERNQLLEQKQLQCMGFVCNSTWFIMISVWALAGISIQRTK